MNILSVDATGPALSLALLARGKTYVLRRQASSRPHDETIFPAVEAILKRAGVRLKDLNAVAAASGPGRFTGIRIGMTYATVTAGTLGIPALALSRLEAAALKHGPGRVCPVLEGPRGEIFYQGLTVASSSEEPRPEFAPAWARPEEWPALREDWLRRGFAVFPAEPEAADLLGLAAAKLLRGRVPAFAPLYLKTAGYERAKHPSGQAC